MSIVMGLDQHRAQITADWLDTETGEVKRARVAPADRAGVRAFLARFRGQRLEVALEATTGWRFVIEGATPLLLVCRRDRRACRRLEKPSETSSRDAHIRRRQGCRIDRRPLKGRFRRRRFIIDRHRNATSIRPRCGPGSGGEANVLP